MIREMITMGIMKRLSLRPDLESRCLPFWRASSRRAVARHCCICSEDEEGYPLAREEAEGPRASFPSSFVDPIGLCTRFLNVMFIYVTLLLF